MGTNGNVEGGGASRGIGGQSATAVFLQMLSSICSSSSSRSGLADNDSIVCGIAVKGDAGGRVSENNGRIAFVVTISSSSFRSGATAANTSCSGCSRSAVYNGTPVLTLAIIAAHAVAAPLRAGSRAMRQLCSSAC